MGREKEKTHMTKTDMPDVPIAIVHQPGQEPGITMPLSAWLKLVALACQTVERAATAGTASPERTPVLTRADLETPDVAAARHRIEKGMRQAEESLGASDLGSTLRNITESLEPLRGVLAEALESAALGQNDENLADRIALEEARRRDEETMPHALVKRLISGDHPVKVFREHRGLTQAQLAERTGLSAMYLSQIETGRRGGSTKTLAKIARALHVDLDDLARWNDDDDTQSDAPRARPVRRAG